MKFLVTLKTNAALVTRVESCKYRVVWNTPPTEEELDEFNEIINKIGSELIAKFAKMKKAEEN